MLVSIIVPVYNVEKYLQRALQSLINQTYTEWEAICVNDGSTDSSPEILNSFASKDKRIRVIHKENGGLSDARNVALQHISGEFFFFLDSDDFLHPQTIEICIDRALSEGSNLVAYTYNRQYRSLAKIRSFLGLPYKKSIKFKNYDLKAIKSITTDSFFNYVTEYSHEQIPGIDNRFIVKHCQVWRCCYKTSSFRHINFIYGIMYEDFPWWGEALLHVEKATIINLPLYYYFPNMKSLLMSRNGSFKAESLKVAIDIAEKLYINNGNAMQKRVWTDRFITPFKDKLAKKSKKQ